LTCYACGKVHEEPVRYCPECGARLDNSSDPSERATPAAAAPAEGGKTGRVTVRLPDLEDSAAITAEPERQTPPAAAEPAASESVPPPANDETAATMTAPEAPPPPAPFPPEVSQPAAASRHEPDNRLIWLIGAGIGCMSILLIGTCLGLLLLLNLSGVLGNSPQPVPANRADDDTYGAITPANPAEVLLADDFSSAAQSSLGSGSDAETSYRFVDGGYQIEILPSDMLAWSRIAGQYRDARIEFDARLLDGPAEAGVGLIFRYQDADNFYLFTVSGDGFYNLEMMSNGRWQTLIDWTAAPAIQPFGRINRLSVTTVADRITLGINGVIVDETIEPRFPDGAAALALTTFEDGAATAMFDNLRISRR
jgi:hypothetical protein